MSEKKVSLSVQPAVSLLQNSSPAQGAADGRGGSLQLVISLISTPLITEGEPINEITRVVIGLSASLQTLSSPRAFQKGITGTVVLFVCLFDYTSIFIPN